MDRGCDIFHGDRAEFAVRMCLEPDPDEGAAISSEWAASWGFFELWVRGRNLCRHVEGGTVLSGVHWYLFPLVEWLVDNWDPLLHEERLPRESGDDSWAAFQESHLPTDGRWDDEQQELTEQWHEWWQRHSLQACRHGGLFPDVFLRRWMDRVEVSWGESRIAGTVEDFCFLDRHGCERLSPATVAEVLYGAIKAIVALFGEHLPESHHVKELAARAESIPGTSVGSRLAWLAGLGSGQPDREAIWRKFSERIAQSGAAIAEAVLRVPPHKLIIPGSCQASLMFGTLSPSVTEADALAVADQLIALCGAAPKNDEFQRLVRQEPLERYGVPSHEQGYQLAEAVLETLGLVEPSSEWVDVESVLQRLGIEVRWIEISDGAIRGMAIAGPRHRPAILVNRSSEFNATPPGYRFTLAHELCHILFDRAYGKNIAMASGPWAPNEVERRAKAFAAMLLMPRHLVQKAVAAYPGDLASEAGLDWVRSRLKTSFKSTLEHLRNLNWLSDDDCDRVGELRDQRFDQAEPQSGMERNQGSRADSSLSTENR